MLFYFVVLFYFMFLFCSFLFHVIFLYLTLFFVMFIFYFWSLRHVMLIHLIFYFILFYVFFVYLLITQKHVKIMLFIRFCIRFLVSQTHDVNPYHLHRLWDSPHLKPQHHFRLDEICWLMKQDVSRAREAQQHRIAQSGSRWAESWTLDLSCSPTVFAFAF